MPKNLRDIVGKKPGWARSKSAREFVNKPEKIKNDRPTEHEANFRADFVPVYDRPGHREGVPAETDSFKVDEETNRPLDEGRIAKFIRKATGGQRRNIIRKSEDASKAAYKQGRTEDAYKHARRAAKAGKEDVNEANSFDTAKKKFDWHRDKARSHEAWGGVTTKMKPPLPLAPGSKFTDLHKAKRHRQAMDAACRVMSKRFGLKEGEVVQFPKKKKEQLPKPGTKENVDRFRKTLPEEIKCYTPMKTKFGKPMKKGKKSA